MKSARVSRSAIALALFALTTMGTVASAGDLRAFKVPPTPAKVVKEHRYRMSGAIRPLLFWVGRDGVGAARITWRDNGDSQRGFELLIGSDPDRAPRGMNRWGWVREDLRADGATQRGVISKIDEETLEQAEAQVGFESEYVFSAIRTEIANGEARSVKTLWAVEKDYTYYDLDEIQEIIEEVPQSPPRAYSGPMTPGMHPGLLFAIDDLINRAVAAALERPRRLLRNVTTHFNFNAYRCSLTLREAKWEESKEYDGIRYQGLVRLEFENHITEDDSRNRFTLVCGTEGDLKGIPVYIKFQPKWWFKTEVYIDPTQVFERPDKLPEQSPTVVGEAGP